MVGSLVISVLFILVFLVFNKGQTQYALQNIKNFYMSPLVWQLSYTDRHSFIQIFFLLLPIASPQEHMCPYYRTCEIHAEDSSNQETENELTEH